MCKDLIKVGWKHAGNQEQADRLKEIFDKMMRQDGEAAVGLESFQGGRKALNWDEQSRKQPKPKL